MSQAEKAGVFLFAGQGPKLKPGVLQDVYDDSPEMQLVFAEADEVCIPKGFSVKELLYGDSQDQLRAEQPSLGIYLPAALTVQIGVARLLKSRGIEPTKVYLGHSFGRLGAAVASNLMPFKAGLRLSIGRGEAQERLMRSRDMVVGLVDDKARQYQGLISQAEAILAASKDKMATVKVTIINHGHQFLIMGDPSEVSLFSHDFKDRFPDIRIIRYKAPPSHSSDCQPAQKECNTDLAAVEPELRKPVRPIISDITGKAMRSVESFVRDSKEQIVRQLRWDENLRGLRRMRDKSGIEVGHSDIFADMAAVECPRVEIYTTNTTQALERVLSRFALPRTDFVFLGTTL